MSELLTAAQMRAIEQAAIESGDVTGLELMERAGQGVVEAIFEEWPELGLAEDVAGVQSPDAGKTGGQPPDPMDISGKRKRAVVLCGPGNNGGDGFVVARQLHQRGWDVEVFLYGDAGKLPPDARVNYERWVEIGSVAELEESALFAVKPYALRIDAVFGTGLARSVSKDLCSAFFASLRELGGGAKSPFPKRVAIDCPSCIDLDSGNALYPAWWWEGDVHMDFLADLTVCFHRMKVGHILRGAWGYSRSVVVKDIGLEGGARPRVDAKRPPMGAVGRCPAVVPQGERVQLVERPCDYLGEDLVGKYEDDHKYTHGHALLLTGGSGKTGAARLAARGALRVGAGLVTLGVPPSAQQEVACQITALMLTRIGDATALDVVLADQRINALCLGPGLGLERARALVPVALAAQRATVLDADALSAFAEAPSVLFNMLHEDCVLTPHGGEFAKLFPDIAAKLAVVPTKGPAYSKVDATREAAARAGCVVLFKGADTVIADPSGRCSVNAAVYERAAPWLATAGSGDVLAGFITGLLARGFAPKAAAETAAWLHVECARAFGSGLIAEDLPEVLPQVLRDLVGQ
ncbi:MAG: NAD(P)H-hydrate dehydratase [Shimia sp.]|uniref:NAD(P)H-hydrate dehydratase n=1 Tax=Shimia sp. TaxID=1954381 RepID=UPI004058D966